jgi:hypothetical protein
VGESRAERSQYQNKKIALGHLVNSNKFKLWLNRKVNEIISGKSIDELVEEAMCPKNLKIEIRNKKGKWEDMKG